MLSILYDDFDQKVKNIHDEMDLHHSYIKKRVRSLYPAKITKINSDRVKTFSKHSPLCNATRDFFFVFLQKTIL